jgi:hypothetical protein
MENVPLSMITQSEFLSVNVMFLLKETTACSWQGLNPRAQQSLDYLSDAWITRARRHSKWLLERHYFLNCIILYILLAELFGACAADGECTGAGGDANAVCDTGADVDGNCVCASAYKDVGGDCVAKGNNLIQHYM